MNSAERTFELLQQLLNSKKNLSDTLVSKGEEASVNEPFDDLVEKAGNYIPKSYIFVDEEGNEVAGTLVSQETIFDATENDVREGKVFASELGVKTGEKVIPSYNTSEGTKLVLAGKDFSFSLKTSTDLHDYTKLQVLICAYNTSMSDSVSTEKVSINGKVYAVNSVEELSTVSVDDETQTINLGIVNTASTPYIIRYFTYKEIY